MKYDASARAIENEEHLIRPRPGDYWHEMFCPQRLVIWTDGEHVEYLSQEHRKSVDKDTRWTWTFEKPAHRCTVEEFGKGLRYNSIPGTFADVCPDHHIWAVEAALEARSKRAP